MDIVLSLCPVLYNLYIKCRRRKKDKRRRLQKRKLVSIISVVNKQGLRSLGVGH